MIPVLATTRTLWYLTRGAGAATLILLTLSVALGILNTLRWSAPPRWPRFVIDALHRNVSLLVLPLLAAHIFTAVLDTFAPIALKDTVIPFVSHYRPVWLGLGAIALDLLLVVIFTSLIRARIGVRTWRAIHWLVYASWPLAVVHSFGAGTDAKLTWMLGLTVVCIVVVLLALAWRVAAGWPAHLGARVGAVGLMTAGPIALLAWLVNGPLEAGWAKRAGTPPGLLATTRTAARATPGAPHPAPPSLSAPFTAELNGTVTESSSGSDATVRIDVGMSGGASGKLATTISGPASPSGGVGLRDSHVSIGPSSSPELYKGRITSLEGTRYRARVSDGSRVLDLRVDLNVAGDTGSATGTVTAVNGGGR
jgi:methionine sulfoxide reductase heme-binding subunit